jgi:hypothetical protein
MIFPAQGATNVPDNLQVQVSDQASSLLTWLPNNGNYYYADLLTYTTPVVTESNFNGPQSSGFTLASNNGTTIQLQSGPFNQGTPVAPQTHYYVYLEYAYEDGTGNQCYAHGSIGDFTTQ